VGNNTYLKRRGDNVAIQLHNTDVVTYTPDNAAILNSGGWRTVTTKARINDYIPGHLYTEAGVWYVSYHGTTYAYSDGMALNYDGTVSGAGEARSKADVRKEKRAIKAFANDYVDALFSGEVDAPSAADCWFCAMFDKNGTGSDDHMQSHLEESYFVPSMIVNAANTFGASWVMNQTLAAIWSGAPPDDWSARFAREQLTKMLYRFVCRAMGYHS
jgi:hypothetical protein